MLIKKEKRNENLLLFFLYIKKKKYSNLSSPAAKQPSSFVLHSFSFLLFDFPFGISIDTNLPTRQQKLEVSMKINRNKNVKKKKLDDFDLLIIKLR